jgi:hypothetical protein
MGHSPNLQQPAPPGDLDDFLGARHKMPQRQNGMFGEHVDSIMQSYLEGNVYIECEVSYRIDGPAQNFVTVIHKARGYVREIKERDFPLSGARHLWRNAGGCIYGPYWDKQSVLVGQIERMQQPKRAVPSLMRFQTAKEVNCLGVSLRRFVSNFAAHPRRMFVECEPSAFDVTASLRDKDGNHVIEGRSGVVNDVASNHAEFSRCVPVLDRAIDSLPVFFMDANRVRIARFESPDLGFELRKVMLCPLYLSYGISARYVDGCGHITPAVASARQAPGRPRRGAGRACAPWHPVPRRWRDAAHRRRANQECAGPRILPPPGTARRSHAGR